VKCRGVFDCAQREKEFAELELRMSAQDFWDDANAAKNLINQANAHRAVLEPCCSLASRLEDCRVMIELAREESDPAQAETAAEHVRTELTQWETAFARLEIQSLLSGPFDHNNAFLSLHAGAGGTESCDWASILFRMYRRYCERRNFELVVLDMLPGDEAGIKSVTFAVNGDFAYGRMKAERGVHRLVRISPFDANSRRHTSFASLDVVAEVDDDFDVEIRDEDLRTDTYRSGGAGGQHVNKTDSAVRITHMPSGIVVACQTERSQHANRAKAMKLLRARLYEWREDQKRKEMERFYGEKGEIAWGRQIRSYVMQPYTMVKDHRTDTETGNVSAVLDGDLDRFVEAWLKDNRADGQG
jgi:peptide chain release factor 2